VFDPLLSAETAKAAYDLVSEHLGKKPVLGVVYSHSHTDHYGGARGIVDEADVKAGKVKIFAPGGDEHLVPAARSALDRRELHGHPA
jgi:alkyl sulfatase BDS1-like metallo-beta-lactamase superfamily hydrolase